MSVNTATALIREAFLKGLAVSGPIIIVIFIIGLLISIFQATTQIQEQTLSFVPKLIAVAVIMIFFGSTLLTMLSGYFLEIMNNIGLYIK